MPLDVREAPVAAMSAIDVGAEEAIAVGLAALLGVTTSSTNDAHSLQSGQRPTHFGDSYPHAWQTYLVCVLAIPVILSEPGGRFNSAARGQQERG